MFHQGRHPVRPLSLIDRLRLGRCFRTDADGRIPLTDDWTTLDASLRRTGRIVIQTRHTAARLISVAAWPTFTITAANRLIGHDATGALQLSPPHLRSAWGALRPCACCRAPARIQMANAEGGAFLHLAALPGAEPALWSDVLASCAPTTSALATLPGPGSAFHYLTLARPFQRIAASPESLVTLLADVGRFDLPMRCTVRSAETCHQRTLTLRHVSSDGSTISAGEPGTRFQLALPAMRTLGITTDSDGSPSLHVLGNHDTLLLTLAADNHPSALGPWTDLLALHLG